MRRLPADRTLDSLVRRREATEEHIVALANVLSRFYAAAPRSPVTAAEYATSSDRHVRDNFAELSRPEHALPRCLVHRVRAAQLTTLALRTAWFHERAASRRIVLGHGDLRCEHVYFTPEPVVIDALAFSRELRTLDAADEVAFLAMELRRLDADALADSLIRAYQAQQDDKPPPGLWRFYQAYRACVRAKVALLRGLQTSESERAVESAAAREYLELADRLSRPLLRPLCVVVRGLSGTGKSTLAAAIAEKLGIVHLQTDRVRRQLFPGAGQAAYGTGNYTSAARQMVYDAMFAQARELLGQGMPVVLDGTFLSAACRLAVATAAGRAGARSIVLACRCPVEVAIERLKARADAGPTESDATEATLRRQAMEAEADPPSMPSTDVDTTRPLEEQVDVALTAISAAWNVDAM
jgi:predicted kinase